MLALQDVLGDDPLLQIKWPNDILHAGAKLAGILLESTQLKSGGFACVIGIGVNCRSHPETGLYPATDLSLIGTLLGHRDDIFLQLSDHFVRWLGIWDAGRNFAAIRVEWLRHAAGVGTRISVLAPQPRDGVFETIDADGRLLLNADGTILAIEAGDVFFPHPSMGALAGIQSLGAAPVSREDRR